MTATAVAITNLVLCLMVRTPSVQLDSSGDFEVGVNTQYIHSVTLHPFDKLHSSRCIICKNEIWYRPQDFLGAMPCRMDFRVEDLKNSWKVKLKSGCDYVCPQCDDGCIIGKDDKQWHSR